MGVQGFQMVPGVSEAFLGFRWFKGCSRIPSLQRGLTGGIKGCNEFTGGLNGVQRPSGGFKMFPGGSEAFRMSRRYWSKKELHWISKCSIGFQGLLSFM